jgi:hypothetical protein
MTAPAMLDLLETVGAQEANNRLAAFGTALEAAGNVDAAGAVTIDRAAVAQAANALNVNLDGNQLADQLAALAKLGFIDFGQIQRGSQNEQVTVPVALLPAGQDDDVQVAHSASTGALNRELVTRLIPGRSIQQVAQGARLQRKIAPDQALAALSRVNIRLPMSLGIGRLTSALIEAKGELPPCSVQIPGVPQAPATQEELGTATQALAKDDVLRLYDCFKNVDNYHAYWWGWSICLDRNCALLLASILAGGGNVKAGAALFAAAKAILAGGGIPVAAKAAVAAMGGPLAFTLAALGFYLVLMINLNVTSRGVCISGNWAIPLPGPLPNIGQFIWAKGR